MSEISFLEKLLDGAEVEWKPLGEMLQKVGKINWAKADRDFTYIDLSSVNRERHQIADTIEIDSKRHPSRAQQIVKKGDVLFGTTRPMLKRFAIINETFDGAIASTGFAVLRPKIAKIHTNFLYHSLTAADFWDYVEKNQKGAGYPAISDSTVKQYLIPIPCPEEPEKSLRMQSEIVRILDTFTELTAELTARRKQYNHYRDQLLSFEEGEVEWKPLGELAENLDSKRRPITSGLREPGDIPYYGASGVVDYVKDYIFNEDLLLVSEDGANLLARKTPIAFSISGKSWVNNHAHILRFETYAERRYIEYYLNSIDLTPYISGAAQPKLNKGNLNNIKIPNPPLEDKVRIVDVLVKFDALTNSISEGLPREIELRQKQYACYRDLPFNFPKPEAVA